MERSVHAAAHESYPTLTTHIWRPRLVFRVHESYQRFRARICEIRDTIASSAKQSAQFLFVSEFLATGWHVFDPYQRATRPVGCDFVYICAKRVTDNAIRVTDDAIRDASALFLFVSELFATERGRISIMSARSAVRTTKKPSPLKGTAFKPSRLAGFSRLRQPPSACPR
jgi:hypothetical protein